MSDTSRSDTAWELLGAVALFGTVVVAPVVGLLVLLGLSVYQAATVVAAGSWGDLPWPLLLFAVSGFGLFLMFPRRRRV